MTINLDLILADAFALCLFAGLGFCIGGPYGVMVAIGFVCAALIAIGCGTVARRADDQADAFHRSQQGKQP